MMAQSNPDWVPNGDVLKFVCAATGTTTFHSLDDPIGKPRVTKLSSYKAINPIGMPHFSFRLLSVFPFTQLLVLDDSYVVVHYWPLEIDKTRLVSRFYFRSPPASYLQQFAQAHMVVSNRDVSSEDSAMTRSQYRALKSGGMKQLYLGENELVIRHMHEMVQAYLSDRVPVERPSQADLDHRVKIEVINRV